MGAKKHGKFRRTKEEIEELRSIADLEDIRELAYSMRLHPSRYMASWERELLIQRAKELYIKGMEEWLNFGDWSWEKRRRRRSQYEEKQRANICRGVIPGSVALPKNNCIGGGFGWRDSKKKKWNNSGKVNAEGKN